MRASDSTLVLLTLATLEDCKAGCIEERKISTELEDRTSDESL